MAEKKNDQKDEVATDQSKVATDKTEVTDDLTKEEKVLADTEQESSADSAKPEKKKKGVGGFFLILVLLLSSALVGGWFAYQYLLQQFDQLGQQQTSVIASLSANIEALQAENQRLSSQQTSLQRALTAVVTDTESQLVTLAERLSASEAQGSQDWTLAEVEYLLRIANQRLITSRDQQTATDMMQAADNILRELAYPELAVVRRQLAGDISRLQLTPPLDVQGLYFELEAMALEIADLPFNSPEGLTASESTPEASEGFFSGVWSQTLSVLSRYVRIDSQFSEPQYLLSDEQRTTRLLSVQLQIRQAQLALLSGQQDVFSVSLEVSADSIENYFAQSQKGERVASRLREMALHQLDGEILDISESIRALSTVVDQLSRMERN